MSLYCVGTRGREHGEVPHHGIRPAGTFTAPRKAYAGQMAPCEDGLCRELATSRREANAKSVLWTD
jgi:hypothetical protein